MRRIYMHLFEKYFVNTSVNNHYLLLYTRQFYLTDSTQQLQKGIFLVKNWNDYGELQSIYRLYRDRSG